MIWVGAKNKIQGFELICGKAHNGTSTLEWRLTPDPGREGEEGWWGYIWALEAVVWCTTMVGVYMSTRRWEVEGVKMNPLGSCRNTNRWNSISQNIFHFCSIHDQLVKITDNKKISNQIHTSLFMRRNSTRSNSRESSLPCSHFPGELSTTVAAQI